MCAHEYSAAAIDPSHFLSARRDSILAWGVSRHSLDQAEALVRRFDGEEDGSWIAVWRAIADRSLTDGRPLDAALELGVARLAVIGTARETELLASQRQCFDAARAAFSIGFERRLVDTGRGGGERAVPVHFYSAQDFDARAALVLISGGLDTYKVELHRMALALARATGFTIAVVDMPGTGETPVRLEQDSEQWYRALLDALPPAPLKGVLGVSFAGLWAVKLALAGAVDFAIDLGGPVDARGRAKQRLAEEPIEMRFLLEGMVDSGRTFAQTTAELLEALSLGGRDLLSARPIAPLLVVNGCDDRYIDLEDSTVFRQFPGAQVVMLPRAGHCAVERSRLLGALLVTWLRQHAPDQPIRNGIARALFAGTRRLTA